MKEQIESNHLASKGSEITAVGTGLFIIVTGVISSVTIGEWAAAVGIMVAMSGLVYRHPESNLVSSRSTVEITAAKTPAGEGDQEIGQ
ncbi:MAG: hypothetical protein ACT6RZ_11080 [Methylophilus sp.]|uniref:hypothetical protein n=1 Tax=Methylophilus sp. TaxID=29541 RepID=UPI0040353740